MLGNGFIGDGGGSSLTRTGAGGVKRGKVEQQRLSSPTPSVAKDLGCTASSRFPGGLTSYENDMRRLLTAVRRCTLHSPFAVTCDVLRAGVSGQGEVPCSRHCSSWFISLLRLGCGR